MNNKYKKAFHLFSKFSVNPISYNRSLTAGYFSVKSGDHEYSVHIDEKGHGSCTCEANSMWGHVCSHIIAVYFWLAVFHHAQDEREKLNNLHKKISELQDVIDFFTRRKELLQKLEKLKREKKLREEVRKKNPSPIDIDNHRFKTYGGEENVKKTKGN